MDPSTKISIAPLQESNYHSWSSDMKALLLSKSLWRIVSGDIKRTAENGDDWDSKSDNAAGLIYLNLSATQKIHVTALLPKAVEMWKKLQDVHLVKQSGPRFLAYQNLFSIVKKDDETLSGLMTRVEDAMMQIQNLTLQGFKLETLYDEL